MSLFQYMWKLWETRHLSSRLDVVVICGSWMCGGWMCGGWMCGGWIPLHDNKQQNGDRYLSAGLYSYPPSAASQPGLPGLHDKTSLLATKPDQIISPRTKITISWAVQRWVTKWSSSCVCVHFHVWTTKSSGGRAQTIICWFQWSFTTSV